MTTYSKTQAREKISDLVAAFRANDPSLADVPEAQIKENYIRKLFRFLNWNADNTGLSVPEWEFVLQRTDEKGKRPDYILQLDGQQLLVMDVKRVKYDMHDPRWMKQVYAYAYSTQSQPTSRKIDFAILTDFQEFILLDCTLYAADPKAVSNFRILDWTCDDYVSQFDTLWELFEREHVRAAARTRAMEKPAGLWARYLSPKKVKANRIPPDKAFLAEMDDEKNGWRVRLARDMKKRNPKADGELITAAVQLLIDRLIFVKALSDREIEEDYLTQLAEQVERSGLTDEDAGWFNACGAIFTKLNRFYNGSVFEPRPELEAVTVSNKVVRDVIRDLQPQRSPYNFAILPVEILGTIYERFLGRVVHATDQRVSIKDKPEVRKAGGVYYTPQYIVEYIVEHTAGKLLSACKTPADAAKLKILDPACGSGSFLLGAYQALIDWHIRYYTQNGASRKRDREAAYYDSDGRVRLTAKLKRRILLNNIFGVDIDAQAVEVTRFSLSLKALEDTRRAELYDEVKLWKQSILPDLGDNIKCGNSLIGNDFSLLSQERLAVKAFEWRNEFPAVMREGGFNAVIGNPPWGAEFTNTHRQYLVSKYPVVPTKTKDSYLYFLFHALAMLRHSGIFGFIIPNTWLLINNARDCRRELLSFQIEEIIDHGDGVFKQATVESSTLILTNLPKADGNCRVVRLRKGAVILNQLVDKDAWRRDEYCRIIIDADSKAQKLLMQLRDKTTPFGVACTIIWGIKPYQVGCGTPPQTRDMLKKRIYHSFARKGKDWKPLLVGSDVNRYAINFPGTQFIKYGKWLMYPSNESLMLQPKILLRQTSDILRACLDEEKFYCQNSVFIVHYDELDLKYLLGLLNSRLLGFIYQIGNPQKGKVFAEIKPSVIKQLPIRRINFSDPADKARHDQIVRLVESMLAMHKQKAAARTQAEQEQIQRQIDTTDRRIDELVYELYDLTPDEIEMVNK